MEKKLFKLIRPLMLVVLISITLNSCKNVFDIEPQDSVDASKMYRNVDDADAAVLGVYSKFLGVAKQYVVLNELRADLMDVTNNADDYLKEINNHAVSAGNPYADPKPFYEVILNCNDVLKNFVLMRQQLKFTQIEFDQRYSDIGALRCWLYLQLAVQYGEVPYVTQPFEKVSDLKDKTKYPMVKLDAMIDSLIAYMEHKVPFMEPYPNSTSIMNISSGTYSTTPFFIDKRLLLGDLYLWKGNYRAAASAYKTEVDLASGSFDQFKIAWNDPVNHNDIGVGYWQRYQTSDVYGLINDANRGWRSIFCRTQDTWYYNEWAWQLFFDTKTNPNSPFVELFANYGVGKYMLKPSQQAMDNWNSQTQYNGFPYDARAELSYSTSSGEPVIMKYLYEYDPLYPYKKPGRMFLYRAAGLHLRFAEAANRDNMCKLSLALLNRGIQTEFCPYFDYTHNNKDTATDLSEIERTDGAYYHYTFPYNFDARMDDGTFSYTTYRKSAKTGNDTSYSVTTTQYPVGIRGTWHRNTGIRGRANLRPALTELYDPRSLTVPATDNKKDSIETALIDEAALELAFEGQRWPDLLRISKRRNDYSFMAERVYNKLLKAGNPNASQVRNDLLYNEKKRFLPFNLN